MAKTNPIGVRFRTDVLDHLKEKVGADTPQQALVFMERFYVQNSDKISILDCLRQEGAAKEEKGTNPTQSIPESSDEAKIFLIKREEILEQIKAIRAEKIPELRNKSVLGQKSWASDQKKRIQELENQLK